jgi:hypothetical protein
VSEKRWIEKAKAATVLQSIPNMIKIVLLEDISNSSSKMAVVDFIQ